MEIGRKRKIDDAENVLIKHLKSTYSKRPKDVPPLREVVIQSIAKNLDYWIKSQINKVNFEIKDRHNASPFVCLSTKDTLAIWNTANSINYDEKSGLNLFLHERLTKFCFSFVSSPYRVNAFKNVILNCKGIKELLITDSNEDLSEDLIQFKKKEIEGFDDIEEICFGYSFIKSLSYNFKSLQLLELPCKNIGKHSYELLAECNQLKVLSLVEPTELDIVTLAKILTSLPMLKSLSLTKNKIEFQSLDVSLRFENILSLNVSSSKIANKGLQLIVKAMPNITSLSIDDCESLTTECFTVISYLESLAHLNAACYPSSYEPIDDDGHFERFLKKQGPRLKLLNLSGYEYIDTRLLAISCPNLEVLNLGCCHDHLLSWIEKSDLTSNDNNSMYDHLLPFEKEKYSLFEVCHKLQTFAFSSSAYNIEDKFEMVFQGDKKLLRNLDISFMLSFEDDMIVGNFFNTFNFENLENLILVADNKKVSKDDIFIILEKHTHLKRLDLEDCHLSDDDIEDIRYVLQESKSEIDVYFNIPLVKVC